MRRTPINRSEVMACRLCGAEKPIRGNFYAQKCYRKDVGIFRYYRRRCIKCVRSINLKRYHDRRAA